MNHPLLGCPSLRNHHKMFLDEKHVLDVCWWLGAGWPNVQQHHDQSLIHFHVLNPQRGQTSPTWMNLSTFLVVRASYCWKHTLTLFLPDSRMMYILISCDQWAGEQETGFCFVSRHGFWTQPIHFTHSCHESTLPVYHDISSLWGGIALHHQLYLTRSSTCRDQLSIAVLIH